LRYAGIVLGWSGTGPRILFKGFLSPSSRRQELHFPAMLLEAAFNDRRWQKIGDMIAALASCPPAKVQFDHLTIKSKATSL
jgi:hypothetical protein